MSAEGAERLGKGWKSGTNWQGGQNGGKAE